MPKVKSVKDIRDEVAERLANEGRSLIWLSRTTGISYYTLFSCLKKKLFSLSDTNLEKINKAIGSNFIKK